MTDEERSRALIDRWAKLFSDELDDEDTFETLSCQFAIVRTNERQAIVASLRKHAEVRRLTPGLAPIHRADVIDAIADQIERGEHSS